MKWSVPMMLCAALVLGGCTRTIIERPVAKETVIANPVKVTIKDRTLITGKKDGIIVVAGHYDTNYPLPKSYVGANDGGSSTALLLAIADQLRGSVWLGRLRPCQLLGPFASEERDDLLPAIHKL